MSRFSFSLSICLIGLCFVPCAFRQLMYAHVEHHEHAAVSQGLLEARVWAQAFAKKILGLVAGACGSCLVWCGNCVAINFWTALD